MARTVYLEHAVRWAVHDRIRNPRKDNMSDNSNFDFPVESIGAAPNLTFHFRGDTVCAELVGARLYGEAEGDERTRLRLTDASGEVLADITLHPRSHRNATENVIDIGSALLWSHWRWMQAQSQTATPEGSGH